jgi:hypothetical protein
MKKVVLIVLVIAVMFVLTAGYIGIVPGLSGVLAKPKDLGIVADPELVTSVNQQVGYEVSIANSEGVAQGEPVYSGEQAISSTFSSQEVTSVLDSWSREWAITPFYDVQVKITGESAEASGVLKLSKAVDMAKSLGYSDSQIEKAKQYASFVNGDLPFYIAGKVSVTSNQVDATTSTIQIGKVTLPENIADAVVVAAEDIVERRISMTPGLSVDSLTLENGAMNLEGTIPTSVKGE